MDHLLFILLANSIYQFSDIILFALLPLLLLASGFFSGTETALFTLTPRQRLDIEKKGGLIANVTDQLMQDPRMLLITLMLGNMIINVSYMAICSALVLKFEKGNFNALWVTLAGVAPLITIVIFGEVLPKMVANTAPVLWTRILGLPMLGLHRLIFPFRWFVGHGIVTPFARLIAPGKDVASLSSEEFHELLEQSRDRGEIDDGEEQILRELVVLNQIKVRDVMVPRVDVIGISTETDAVTLRNLVYETRMTKFPVYEEDMDHIVGMIFARDVLLARAKGHEASVKQLMKPVEFVPEIQRLDQLMTHFRKSGRYQAIAVDEYGGTAGLITLKDIAERMLGDLDMDEAPGEGNDEYVLQISENVWRVSGRLNARDWANAMGLNDLPSNATTVGGLILALLNRMPQYGDTVTIRNIELMIEKMHGTRIESVVLRLIDPSKPAIGDEDEDEDASTVLMGNKGEIKR